MIHKAKDLSADQKALIENLLGRRVLDEEAVSIRAFEPPTLPAQGRQEVADELKRYFAEVDANRGAGSPNETDEIIAEAMRSVRPGYRPHQ